MQFKFTDEQRLIRETVAAACEDICDERHLFDVLSEKDGFDRAAWTMLTQDLSMSGIAISEDYSGSGLGIVELASVMEKMGKVLLPTPFFTSIALSAMILQNGDDETLKSTLLPELASGQKICSFAYLTQNGNLLSEYGGATLSKSGLLNGQASYVQYGEPADYFLVLCASPNGKANIVAVEAHKDGVKVQRKTSMDLTRPICDVSFDETPILGVIMESPTQISRSFDIGRVCLASEQLGAAEAILEKTRTFVLERRQFGRQIGSFQAIKHRMADMMVLNEAAKSAAWYAACAADETPNELAKAAATAMIVTSRALSRKSGHMIQLHGGMGFTWECVAHLYFKRAAFSTKLLGDPTQHRESLAAIALGEVA